MLPLEDLSTKLVVVMVEAWTAMLNVAVTVVLVATPVALAAGVALVTVGATAAAVVNDQEVDPLMGSPAVSFAPLTAAVYVVPYANAALGVKVTVLLELL